MSLFLCQSFITNINITQPEKYRQPQVQRPSAQFSAVFTSTGLPHERPRWGLWGLAGAPKHRLGRSHPSRSCRRGQPGISDLTTFIHPCPGPPVKAQGGWAAPVGAATCRTSFSAAYICFSYLSQVLTMQPSIPAGQGGQAGRWVCPAAGRGGLWHLVRQLVASRRPGLLLCGAGVCNACLLFHLGDGLGWGCRLLGWLAQEAVLSLSWWTAVLQVPRGARLQDFSGPASSRAELPTGLEPLFSERCLWELAKKETEIWMLLNQKSGE